MTARSDEDVRPQKGRSVAERTLRILGTFREGRVRQTLSELSRRSGVPLTTTHRIVGELVTWGALEQDVGGRYRIGLRLWEVASLAPRSMGLQSLARPFLSDLYELTKYSVHLAVLEGTEAVFVDRFQSPHQTHLRPRVGGRYPLHATAVGLVLLAHSSSEFQDDVLEGDLTRYTEYSFRSSDEVRPVLADIRVRGYAISDRQVNPEYVAVAAPVLAPNGSTAAALSVVLSPHEADDRNLIHLVRVTAAGISRALRSRG